MMWLKCWLLALVAAVLLDAAAAAITIDDFSVGPLSLVGPTGPTDYSGLDANHVIGGSRHIWVGLPSAPNTLDVSLGQLEFATGGGPDLGSLSLVYGESAPLGANLSAGDRDRVRVRFTEVTAAAPFSAGFTIRDAANQAFSFPIGNGMLALNGLDGVIELPFSAATINYANISRISLDLLGYTVNGTFAIDEIASAGPVLAGDYNRDEVVDNDDYAEWKKLYGASVVGPVILAADGSGNSTVDAGDYVVWRNNLGGVLGGGGVSAAPIPEPATGSLALLGVAIIALTLRSRAGAEA